MKSVSRWAPHSVDRRSLLVGLPSTSPRLDPFVREPSPMPRLPKELLPLAPETPELPALGVGTVLTGVEEEVELERAGAGGTAMLTLPCPESNDNPLPVLVEEGWSPAGRVFGELILLRPSARWNCVSAPCAWAFAGLGELFSDPPETVEATATPIMLDAVLVVVVAVVAVVGCAAAGVLVVQVA